MGITKTPGAQAPAPAGGMGGGLPETPRGCAGSRAGSRYGRHSTENSGRRLRRRCQGKIRQVREGGGGLPAQIQRKEADTGTGRAGKTSRPRQGAGAAYDRKRRGEDKSRYDEG